MAWRRSTRRLGPVLGPLDDSEDKTRHSTNETKQTKDRIQANAGDGTGSTTKAWTVGQLQTAEVGKWTSAPSWRVDGLIEYEVIDPAVPTATATDQR